MTPQSLFCQYQKPLYGFAYRIVGNKQVAEDIVQNVFVKLLSQSKEIENINAWLYCVARNMAYDSLRTRQRWGSIFIDESGDDVEGDFYYVPSNDRSSQNIIEDKELMSSIQSAIQNLKPQYQRVSTLYYIHGMDYDSIQKQTGWPMGTIRSRLNRSRRDLQKQNILRDAYTS